MKFRLTEDELKALVVSTALKHKLKAPSDAEIAFAYETGEPVIVCSEAGFIWISRDYAAYSLLDEDVNYVYITAAYILDERGYYLPSSSRQLHLPILPPDVERALRKADAYMKYNHTFFWVADEFSQMMEENDGCA